VGKKQGGELPEILTDSTIEGRPRVGRGNSRPSLQKVRGQKESEESAMDISSSGREETKWRGRSEGRESAPGVRFFTGLTKTKSIKAQSSLLGGEEFFRGRCCTRFTAVCRGRPEKHLVRIVTFLSGEGGGSSSGESKEAIILSCTGELQ